MTHPNPVRTLSSHGVEDQTSAEWVANKSCLRTDSGAPTEVLEQAHHMISIKTESTLVPYVEQCSDCGWVDPASLTWWAENAVKLSMNARSQRIALAAETEPFAFVQQRGEVLTLEEILYQALGAASLCWATPEGAGEFNSSRAKAIGLALMGEVDRSLEIVQQRTAGPLVELVYEFYALACNSQHDGHGGPDAPEQWKAAFERLKARFHALLDDPGKVESGVDGAVAVGSGD